MADDDKTPEREQNGAAEGCLPDGSEIPAAVRDALAALDRLWRDNDEITVARARVAGLETAVVGTLTPGGLVPLFVHISPDIAQVLAPVTENGRGPKSRLN
jgi:hypothetical protein